MSFVKNITAKSLDWVMKRTNGRTLDIAREIIPLRVKRLLSRLLSSEISLSDELITTKDGHKFVAIKEPVFLQVRYEGTYEKFLSAVTRKLISKGDIVVDVGANFGWYSILMAAEAGNNGRVFSYEPNGAIYPVLTRNIELNNYNDIITLTNCGIGEKEEVAYLSAGDDESAIGYFDKNKNEKIEKDISKGIKINSLDNLLVKYFGKISFIKVDVEGFEPFVMRGAKKIFASKNPPTMLMEFNIEALERQDIDIDKFVDELISLDMNLAKLEHGKLVKMDNIPKTNENIFFLPKKGKFKNDITNIQI